MNQCSLDTLLTESLMEMSTANWVRSQKLLASRLEKARELGNERLNLFLLSVAAASGGYQDLANQLWGRAQSAVLDADTLRYLDLQLAPNDPRQSMLIDLERAWWNFNGWNQPTRVLTLETAGSVDWEYVVDATLHGDDAGLEEAYGGLLGDPTEETAFLWNLVALAYLQAGNLRTYDEMVQTQPPLPSPDTVPPGLASALEARGLSQALQVLKEGRWLTNAALSDAAGETATETDSLGEEEWVAGMKNGFFLLDFGRTLEAARQFQQINSQTEDRHRLMLGLNALALTFFKTGDYTQAEKLYHEFRAHLEQSPLNPRSELALQYTGWLESIGAAPEDGSAFFTPFGTKSHWNEDSMEEEALDFWPEFDRCVNLLGEGDHAEARRILQKIEVHMSDQLDGFERYLVALMFLAGSAMAGDHGEVQELGDEVARLESAAVFPPDRVEDVADALRWAGFEGLYRRLAGGFEARAVPLNPWEDVLNTKL